MSAARIRLAAAAAALSLLVLAPGALAAGTLTVTVTGQGSAAGPGIDCTQSGGPDCSEPYADVPVEECFPTEPGKPDRCVILHEAPTVQLTAGSDANGFVYDGWNGCDSFTGRTCDVTVDASKGVTAKFRDGAAPGVATPTPGSGVRRGTVLLATTATDNAGVTRVEFYDGAAKLGEDFSAPYELSWNTATVSDGAKSITAKAYDAAGNVATSGAAAFTVDNTAPSLVIDNGPNGQTFGPGTTQTWNFTASDANAVSVLCSVVTAGSQSSFGACSSAASHAVSNKPDGSYTFVARATDAAGNAFTTGARTFSIDAVAPETTIGSGPADGFSSTATAVTFGFGASQAGSTFQCRVYPAALTPPAFGACSSATGHTASGFSPGTYAFEVRATDPYGNVDASPAKRTFTVTAPATDPGTGTGTGTGTETSTGTGTGTVTGTSTGTTTGTGTQPPVAPPPATLFDPRISSGFDYTGPKTTFTVLALRNLPKGSKVLVTCKGKGCAFKRKAFTASGTKLNVLKKLRKVVLRKGAVLQLAITGPGGQKKVVTWKVRAGRGPATSYRCAAPGAKLGSCG